ncbi:MAG: hypothetical protein WCC10_17310 [Tumebacillaceae bacterium]
MRDEDLRSQTDYSAGQREAAHRVLIEVVNLLGSYQEDIRIVGGWVPDLLFPGLDHVGSIDVDLLINHPNLQETSYQTIERILLNNAYHKHPEKYFTFVKEVEVDDVEYDVDLDILAGMYGGTNEKRGSQKVQGITALKATGGNFAFEVPPTTVRVEARRPDGALDVGRVNVVSIVPYLVMKAAALGRGKSKDAYDIFFCIKNYSEGIDALAQLFEPFITHGLVCDMIEKLSDKFASPEHAGPEDIAAFREAFDDEEAEMIKRDAYENVDAFLTALQSFPR